MIFDKRMEVLLAMLVDLRTFQYYIVVNVGLLRHYHKNFVERDAISLLLQMPAGLDFIHCILAS